MRQSVHDKRRAAEPGLSRSERNQVDKRAAVRSTPAYTSLCMLLLTNEEPSCLEKKFGQMFSIHQQQTAWGAQLLDLSSRADPDFLPRGTGQASVCAFL
jgi:hypothetical protein